MNVKMEAAMNVNGKEKEKWESSLMTKLQREVCICVCVVFVCVLEYRRQVITAMSKTI